LLSSVRDTIVLAMQFQLAFLSFPLLADVAHQERRLQFGAPGFDDQANVMQWAQGNVDELRAEPVRIIVFGHGAGSWAACHITWGSAKERMLSGVISQFGFCGGTHSIQCQRQSDILTRSVQKVCSGKGFTLLHHIRSFGALSLSTHGGDSNTACAFGRKTHHEVPLSFQRSSVSDHVDMEKPSHVRLNDTYPLFWPWGFNYVHPDWRPNVLGDPIDMLSAVTSLLGLYWRVGVRRAHVRKHWVCTNSGRGGGARRASFQTTIDLVMMGVPVRSIRYTSGSFPTFYV